MLSAISACSSSERAERKRWLRRWSMSTLRAIAKIQVCSLAREGSNRLHARTTRSNVATVRSSAVSRPTQ